MRSHNLDFLSTRRHTAQHRIHMDHSLCLLAFRPILKGFSLSEWLDDNPQTEDFANVLTVCKKK